MIDRARMESVFDELVTLNDEPLAVIAHEPTRAFLRDVGLPEREQWFEADGYLVDGDLRVGGEAWQAVQERYSDCPFDMSSWLTLGGIGMDTVAVDTVTGVVYCIPEDRYIHVLNSSVDALGYFLYELEMERPEYDGEAAGDAGFDPEGAEQRLLTLMRRADPVAVESPDSSWYMVLRYVRNALMD
ncbi:SUKH-4 family immunity protein [Streptomyces sp. NPDC006134]|uniref:SUKH-4 family immunity protein n=1 Tax=Streptomyces sp. NPDC006134 TaxID=3154467 RepID=UPI0033DD9D82